MPPPGPGCHGPEPPRGDPSGDQNLSLGAPARAEPSPGSAGGRFLWAVSQLTRAKSQNKRETGSSLTSERSEIATGSSKPREQGTSAPSPPLLYPPGQGRGCWHCWRSLLAPEEQVWGAEGGTWEQKIFGGYERTG